MKKYRMTQNERAALNIRIIGDIARELREDRGRDAAYAMKAARRYVGMYYPVKDSIVKVYRHPVL